MEERRDDPTPTYESLYKYLDSIIENAYVMMVVLETDGTVRLWNRAAAQITGYPASEVVGKRDIWKKIYPDPKYRDTITGRIAEILKEKNYFENLVARIKTKDGSFRTIAWNTREFTTGSGTQAIAVGRDITELEKIKNELSAMSDFQKAVIENANILLTVLDSSGKIHVWNKAAEQITGYTAGDVIGNRKIWRRLYPDSEYRKDVNRRIEEMIREKNYFANLETTILASDGTHRIISWNTREISYKGDSRIIAVGLDITAQKEAEIALVAYITEAAMRLKNPVEIIRDNLVDICSLLKNRKIETDDVITLLDIQARNATQIVSNLQELQQAVIDKSNAIPDSYRDFLLRG